MSTTIGMTGNRAGHHRRIRWWIVAAAVVLHAWLVHASPCGVDPCDVTSNGSTQGCWDLIDPVCPEESLTCVCGFPNLQAIHAVLTYNATDGVPRVIMFGSSAPYHNWPSCPCPPNCPQPRATGWGVALWNPVTHAGSWHFANWTDFIGAPQEDLFCSGHTILGDGRVLFVGGTDRADGCGNNTG